MRRARRSGCTSTARSARSSALWEPAAALVGGARAGRLARGRRPQVAERAERRGLRAAQGRRAAPRDVRGQRGLPDARRRRQPARARHRGEPLVARRLRLGRAQVARSRGHGRSRHALLRAGAGARAHRRGLAAARADGARADQHRLLPLPPRGLGRRRGARRSQPPHPGRRRRAGDVFFTGAQLASGFCRASRSSRGATEPGRCPGARRRGRGGRRAAQLELTSANAVRVRRKAPPTTFALNVPRTWRNREPPAHERRRRGRRDARAPQPFAAAPARLRPDRRRRWWGQRVRRRSRREAGRCGRWRRVVVTGAAGVAAT